MKNLGYAVFWHNLHRRAKKNKFPLRVMFELTYRCNFKCKHCYVPASYKARKGELATRQILNILDQLKETGCFYLGVTGGEPFIRKDIFKILFYAKRKGFRIIIYTNGSLIDRYASKELARLRPDKIDITIPAYTKDCFEAISGVSGSHKNVFRAIESLYAKKIPLGFKSCILKENKKEIKSIQNFAKSLNAACRLDDILMPRLDGSREPYSQREELARKMPVDSRMQNSLDFYSADTRCDYKKFSKNKISHSIFNCGAGKNQAAISPFGELKICLMINKPGFPIDTKNKLSLLQSWKKLKKFIVSVKPDKDYKCDSCSLVAYCKWCPARSFLINGRFTSCDPILKVYAENLKNSITNKSKAQV